MRLPLSSFQETIKSLHGNQAAMAAPPGQVGAGASIGPVAPAATPATAAGMQPAGAVRNMDAPVGDIYDLPAHMLHFINFVAPQAQVKQNAESRLERALAGEDVETQEARDMEGQLLNAAADVAERGALLDDRQFSMMLEGLTSELGRTIAPPSMPALQSPSLGQLGAGLLAGLLDPARAADYAGMPYQFAQAEQQRGYEQDVMRYQGELGQQQQRIRVFGDLTNLMSDREMRRSELEERALARADARTAQFLSLARTLEADMEKLTMETAPVYFSRLRQIYNQAGFPNLAPTREEEIAAVAAIKEREAAAAQMKAQTDRRKLIPSLLTTLRSQGVSAARGMAGAMLMQLIQQDPDLFFGMGYDPAAVAMQIEELRKPTPQEQLASERAKNEVERGKLFAEQVKLTSARAKQVAKATAWMDHENSLKIAKTMAEISNLNSMIQDRGAKQALEWHKANQEAVAKSQQTITTGMSTLSTQINTLVARVGQLEDAREEARLYAPDQVKAIDTEIRETQAKINELRELYSGLKTEGAAVQKMLQGAAPASKGGKGKGLAKGQTADLGGGVQVTRIK